MITRNTDYSIQRLRGLSTDTKPVNVPNGSEFREMDTGKDFMYDEASGDWKEQPKKGGGGGVEEEMYRTPYSDVIYTKNHTVTLHSDTVVAEWRLNTMIPAVAFAGAENLQSILISVPTGATFSLDNSHALLFYGCVGLKSVVFDTAIGSFNGSQIFSGCTSLQSVQIGSMGKPFTGTTVTATHFNGLSALETITMFVNATTYEDIPSNIKNNAPFGAPNADVIYKNSTTGEVIYI